MTNRTSTTQQRKRPRTWMHRAGAVLFWIALWQLASVAVGSEFILAGPVDATRALLHLLPQSAFWIEIATSGIHIALGTLIAYALAMGCSVLAWRLPLARELLAPAMSAIKGTPLACVVVVLLIWFGSRQVSMWAVLLMALPAIYFAVLKGLDSIDPHQAELFDVFGARAATRLRALVWPSVLPYLTAASESTLGMSWKAGIAAELIGVPTGSIGERIYQAKLLLETADIFAWTIVVVALAWGFERAILAALHATWPACARAAARGHISSFANEQKCTEASEAHRLVLAARGLVAGHCGHAVAGPFTFDLLPRDALALIAPSGSGKSTLLSTLAGLLDPIDGVLKRTASHALATPAVFQDTRLIEDLSAEENVAMLAGCSMRQAGDLLRELLDTDALERPVRELSGGQRRRVEIVRALACKNCSLVLLDEPFTGLDDENRKLALAFVARHLGERALVVSTHETSDAIALGAKILKI